MILVVHIIIAVSSAVFTLYTYLLPSQALLRVSSYLIGLTLVTGTVLVVNLKANLVRSCMTGLIFIGFSLAGIFASRYKLAIINEALTHER